MAGWGNFFGKIADQFQGRIERLKNEERKLINEQKKLMSMVRTPTGDARVAAIDNRLREITKTITTASN